MFRDMYDQAKLKELASSPLFADGAASRLPPPGSVPRASGDAAEISGGRRGSEAIAALDAADAADMLPASTNPSRLARGRERYVIYCAPCHGGAGEGDGLVVRRGFPAPPPYRIDRLRAAPDRHFFDVMTKGYGVMLPYADRVDADDRWAIVAWIRRLQRDAVAPVASAAAASDAKSPEPRR
jgi:mono/diheme cytochrome c family protein